jgi:O-antigen/teichoic acid export membrane protein
VNLFRRSVSSTAWNVVSNGIQMVVFFGRSVLLARMLPPQVFGIYALADSIVTLTITLPNFGMGGAFLHRSSETQDEQHAAATHFTLKLLFVLLWLGLVALGAFLFTTDETRMALLLIAGTTAGVELAQTPRLILTRRVVHRRLALLNALNALLTTLVALGLAWQGATLWALLSTNIVNLVVAWTVLYVWKPVWRPRWSWSPATIRYYLRFGSRNFLASVLLKALDRVDDLWTGIYLGDTPLGFYSKAYSFATYPRSILAAPLGSVAAGTYAELKEDRKRLSKAFFRTNALLVRSGFFLAGILALIAPEFIRLLLTEKWLPMLDAFRLMLVFTLLDPIKTTVANLFIAVGKPEQVIQARLVQLTVLLLGLFVLGPILGIAGVALAVNVMLVAGITLLLLKARPYVDFSIRRLFAAPAVALIIAALAAWAVVTLRLIPGSDWWTGGVKIVIFSALYLSTLLLLERKDAEIVMNLLRELWPKRKGSAE